MIHPNLGLMRYRVSFATGLSNQDGTAEQGMIDGYLNEGYTRFLDRTRCHVECANTSADGDDVAIEEPILLFDSVQTVAGEFLIHVDRETLLTKRNAASQDLVYSTAGGNRLMINPAGSVANPLALHVYYVPIPNTLALPADEPTYVPVRYRHALESYAKWKIGSTDEHRGSQIGAQWKTEWDEALSDCRKSLWRTGGRVAEGMRPAVR